MTKITVTDVVQDVVIKMAEGNPGAMTAIIDIVNNLAAIDPQDTLGYLSILFQLDEMGLYGTDIYILYNDKCNKDVRKMIMLFRAVQLGYLPQEKIIEMGKDQSRTITLTEDEFTDLDKKVCDFLSDFAKP